MEKIAILSSSGYYYMTSAFGEQGPSFVVAECNRLSNELRDKYIIYRRLFVCMNI